MVQSTREPLCGLTRLWRWTADEQTLAKVTSPLSLPLFAALFFVLLLAAIRVVHECGLGTLKQRILALVEHWYLPFDALVQCPGTQMSPYRGLVVRTLVLIELPICSFLVCVFGTCVRIYLWPYGLVLYLNQTRLLPLSMYGCTACLY